jgi:hypothetical protein
MRRKSKTQFVKEERKTQLHLELFKVHCAATIHAKNASFHKNIFKCNFLNKKVTYPLFLKFAGFVPGSPHYQALDLTTTL